MMIWNACVKLRMCPLHLASEYLHFHTLFPAILLLLLLSSQNHRFLLFLKIRHLVLSHHLAHLFVLFLILLFSNLL